MSNLVAIKNTEDDNFFFVEESELTKKAFVAGYYYKVEDKAEIEICHGKIVDGEVEEDENSSSTIYKVSWDFSTDIKNFLEEKGAAIDTWNDLFFADKKLAEKAVELSEYSEYYDNDTVDEGTEVFLFEDGEMNPYEVDSEFIEYQYWDGSNFRCSMHRQLVLTDLVFKR